MKKSFLDSLKDLPKDEAEALVAKEGFEAFVIKPNQFVAAVARSNVVYLEVQDGVVKSSAAGDPCVVEYDLEIK